jgi:hypothetical protein
MPDVPALRCPRCGAPQDHEQPDALARCPWCAALLLSADLPPIPLTATPRLDENDARRRVTQALRRRAAQVATDTPRLVFYPFAVQPSARRPYRPLSALPPSVIDAWRPSGADMVRDATADADGSSGEVGGREATRVPISLPVPDGVPTVHYPFYRVPVRVEGVESAAWCDGVDGQVILGEETDTSVEEAEGAALHHWAVGTVGVALLLALILPFPYALVPIGAAGAYVYRGGFR